MPDGRLYLEVLKCGEEACEQCRSVHLHREAFDRIKHFPFPVPGEDWHYKKKISDVLRRDICSEVKKNEEFRPSQKKVIKTKVKTRPFYASVQYIKNSQLMVQCEECKMWRLVFSKYIQAQSSTLQKLQRVISDYSYTCGAKLDDLNLGEELKDIKVKDHSCEDSIEKLYYSASFEPICVYCAVDQSYSSQEHYPQCEACAHLPQLKK